MLTLKRLLSLLTIILSITLSSCGGGGGSGSGGGSGGGDTLYTLTFYDGDDHLTDLTIRELYGTEITLPTPLAKADHTFDGWVKNSIGGIIKSDADSPITGSYTVTANVIFYAKWTKETPAPKYNVTFYNGGVLLPQFSQTVESGKEINLPPLVSACSPFEGWLVNGSGQPFTGSYKVEGDLRFDAKFTEPVNISTPRELYNIRNDLSGKYRLTNNISLSDYSTGWNPIGDAANPFIGCFDGNGFKVTELYVDVSGSGGDVYAGLFGYIDGGEISNIGVKTAVVNANNNSGYTSYAGIIAAFVINGTITDSYATGDVTAGGHGYSYAGGLVGYMGGGSITDSYATGDVTATSSSTNNSHAGGLVGWMSDGSITDSYATGDVTAGGHGYSYAGGLVGSLYGSITDSYATGDVFATASSADRSYSNAGGLVGEMEGGSITNSYATGDVSAAATRVSLAGGLVGFMRSGSITDSYATGDVTATSSSTNNSHAGGLVGAMDGGNITNSVAANLIVEITQGTRYMGRIVGGIGGVATVTNNFALDAMKAIYNGNPSAFNGYDNGEDKTEAQLKDQSTYEGLGWEFGNSGEAIWKMPSGGGYPILYWQ